MNVLSICSDAPFLCSQISRKKILSFLQWILFDRSNDRCVMINWSDQFCTDTCGFICYKFHLCHLQILNNHMICKSTFDMSSCRFSILVTKVLSTSLNFKPIKAMICLPLSAEYHPQSLAHLSWTHSHLLWWGRRLLYELPRIPEQNVRSIVASTQTWEWTLHQYCSCIAS